MGQEEVLSESAQKAPQKQLSIAAAAPAVCRLLEILVCILCLCLIVVPYDNKLFLGVHRAGYVYTCFIMPVIVHIVTFISQFRKQPSSKLTMCLFNVIFGAMLLGAGAIIIQDWNSIMRRPHSHPAKMFMDMMISSGIFSLFASLISFANVYLIYKFM